MQEISLKKLQSEELHYEYKSARGGLPGSIWETYSAFANTDGGYIYLGIDEPKKRQYTPAGLSLSDIEDLKTNLFNTVNNKDKVSINLLTDDNLEVLKVDNCYVLKVRIDKCSAQLKPVYINNNVYKGTYRRNADGDYHCSVEEINAMIRDSNIKASDIVMLEDHDISSIDYESVQRYKNLFASIHVNHPFLKEGDERFLEFVGAAKLNKNNEYKLTKAGLLMFGYSYRIVYEYSDYFLDYQKIGNGDKRWEDRIESTSGTWSGNVFTFFEKVLERLTGSTPNPFETEGLFRRDSGMYFALREALCNTLCNADYLLPGGVVIKHYRNYVDFKNPGCLMMDINQMIKGGDSLPRNKTMLKMFNLIGIGERAGGGVPLIYSVAKDNSLSLPLYEEGYSPDYTLLHLNIKKGGDEKVEGLTQIEHDILNYLRDNTPRSAKEISEYLNKNITTVKLSLYDLVDKSYISTSGTIRDKKYFL